MSKYCFVPGCGKSTKYFPNLRFVSVPHNTERLQWFFSVGKATDNVNMKTTYFCCETHFNMDSDAYQIRDKDGKMCYKINYGVFPIIGNSVPNSMKPIISTTSKKYSSKSTQIGTFLYISQSTEQSTQTEALCTMSKSTEIENQCCGNIEESDYESIISTVTSVSERVANSEEYVPDSSEDESFDTFSCLPLTLSIMKRSPRHYMGINKNCMHVISLLMTKTKLSETKIMLTLRKIRLNEGFKTLGDLFDIDRRRAGEIFTESVGPIAKYVKKFMKYVGPKTIKRNLPISFRRNYCFVGCIIDCFESQIEKPSKPKKQSKSFSQYKKCNTVKHLLSVTPDGLINYVTRAYGGRSSDMVITTNSKLDRTFKSNCSVMADRGFKGIDTFLLQKGTMLVRPPSASKEQMTKREVKLTKQIASLRIHVERAIGRIREFEMLKPHVTLDAKLIKHIDNIVKIACGLVNVQQQLIKTN